MRAYHIVSGLFFTVFAAGHLFRAIRGFPFVIGNVEFPTTASWFALVVAGAMAFWAFRTMPKA